MKINRITFGIGLSNLVIGIITATPENFISFINIIIGCIFIASSIQNENN